MSSSIDFIGHKIIALILNTLDKMSQDNATNVNEDLYPGRDLKTICLFDVDGPVTMPRQVRFFISMILISDLVYS